ncbi:MAG: hypothetical protein H7Y39_13300 [Nitrospiraceae bacterium]|nr:hypothetical protein [Nitrospiraceae bacterium]
MHDESTPIISRIQWCRLQQQYSVTPDERAGWRAEESGLVDALGSRDRIAFMQHEYRPYFHRYKCGLEDGQAILRLTTITPGSMTPMPPMEGAGLITTPSRVVNRSVQALYEESKYLLTPREDCVGG